MLPTFGRASLCLLVIAPLACGGAQKPAESLDTSSLESSSSSTGGSKPTAEAPASTEGAGAGSASTGSTGGAAPAAAPPEAAAAAPMHPVPSATGSIDGKPFAPKLAQIAGPLQKDGRVTLIIHEGDDCMADAKPGEASMILTVPWKDGYKTDLASLRRAKKGNLGEAAFVRVGDDGKKQVSTTFKPTGLVTVVSASTKKDALGKVKIDLQTGDYLVAGDLDVKVCGGTK
jgi:hypothetical protein